MKPELSMKAYQLRFWGIIFFMLLAEVLLLYKVPRSDFFMSYGLMLVLFFFYFKIIYDPNVFSLTTCIGIAVLLRLVALFNEPVLSDDYFRFIWDGKMILNHTNPFRYTPSEYMQLYPGNEYLKYLLENMNSQGYHSIYPPVLQYLFAFCAWMFPTNTYGSMFLMKIFIFTGELFSLRLLSLYTREKNIAVRNILWYALNPLIIVELTGNIHFEGLLVYFMIAFLYFLHVGQYKKSAIFWALAVCTKIIPLMLVPLLFRFLGWRKFIVFGTVALIVMMASTAPFLSVAFLSGISSSARLFYHLFEFNAPAFYLIREIGYHYVNYDIIEETAPKLGILTLIIIFSISWWPTKKRDFETRSLWIFSVYFLFSTMVHPWYPAILMMLSVFTKYKFPIIFSLLIPLSYFPYSLQVYDENMWVILLEYCLLLIFMILEWKSIQHKNHSPLYLPANYSTPN